MYKNKNYGIDSPRLMAVELTFQVFLYDIKLPYTFHMFQIIRRVDQIHPITKRTVCDLFILFSIVFLYIFLAKYDNTILFIFTGQNMIYSLFYLINKPKKTILLNLHAPIIRYQTTQTY